MYVLYPMNLYGLNFDIKQASSQPPASAVFGHTFYNQNFYLKLFLSIYIDQEFSTVLDLQKVRNLFSSSFFLKYTIWLLSVLTVRHQF